LKIYPAQLFYGVMSSFLKYLIAASILSVLVGSDASSDAQPSGFIEGHVKIFPLSDVNLADDAAAANAVTAEPYAEYPLIVLSRDRTREIARVTADENGKYRVALPPGDYILDVQGRAPKRVRAKPQAFTIVSNQTVRVDVDIDTGIR
jgi:hypothetical protein